MNTVSSKRSENLKSRIPVANHQLKSKIPVSVKVSKVSELNDKKKENTSEKKPLVSLQLPNAKKTALQQKSCAPVKELQKQPIKIEKAPRNKLTTNSKHNTVKVKTECLLKDNMNTKINKINNKQAAFKNPSQVNEQKAKSNLKKIDVKKTVSEENKDPLVPDYLKKINVKKTVPKENKDPLVPDYLKKINVKKTVPKENKNRLVPDYLKKINVKKTVPKENEDPLVPDYLSAQKDIKFEANECFRNMILTGRELSPSILKLQPGVKLSTLRCDRPSVYKKFEVSGDPFSEALRRVEKLSLSIKKNKVSSVKRENKPSLSASPFKMGRPSFYSPSSNPQEVVLRRLQEFKEKRMRKKTKNPKKVTFNLTVEECSTTIFKNRVQTPFRNTEDQLTQIIEKSEENTPASPESKADVLSAYDYLAENVKESNCGNILEGSKEKPANTIFDSYKNTDNVSTPNLLEDNVNKIISSEWEKSQNFFTPFSKSKTGHDLMKSAQVKVYTPCPVSFNSKTKLTDCAEIFVDSTADRRLSQYAPICTPLVLKSLANSPGSPEVTDVRLKLDFAEEEKESPKKFTKSTSLINLQNIETFQKKLDSLADNECCILFINENTTPVICGRYLQNPIAQTLSEGDDMHFIPIEF